MKKQFNDAPMPHSHLSIEFIFRYVQLKYDGKDHYNSLRLAKEEYINKIDFFKSVNDTVYFLDESGCTFDNGEWELHSKIK